MGGKGSKPVTGENGTITYKVDVYGANIRQKFDSGDLQLSDEQLTFTGAKANFQWSIKDLKRYGSAKKVFTIEINEHNAELDSREIKFKSKHAASIYEQFKNKVGELGGLPEEKKDTDEAGGETKSPAENAANATDEGKTAENESVKKDVEKNGTVQTDKEGEEGTKDNAKESEKGEEDKSGTPVDMTLTTNPTITVQTPSPTTEKPESDQTTPGESKADEQTTQESEEKQQKSEEKPQESEEKPQESEEKPEEKQQEEVAAEENAVEDKAAEPEATPNEPTTEAPTEPTVEEPAAESPPAEAAPEASADAEAPATETVEESTPAGNEETEDASSEVKQEEKEAENQPEDQSANETNTEKPAADAPSAEGQEGD